MKHNWVIVGCAAVILAGCSVTPPPNQDEQKQTTLMTAYYHDRQQAQITVDQLPLTVELATTASSTAQGLSGRQEIGADGMLFIFPTAQVRHFWMKEMLFAIDIVWIEDKKIVGITKNVQPPAPDTLLVELPTYPSPKAVTMVLEVPAGFADQHQWQVGDSISLE